MLPDLNDCRCCLRKRLPGDHTFCDHDLLGKEVPRQIVGPDHALQLAPRLKLGGRVVCRLNVEQCPPRCEKTRARQDEKHGRFKRWVFHVSVSLSTTERLLPIRLRAVNLSGHLRFSRTCDRRTAVRPWPGLLPSRTTISSVAGAALRQSDEQEILRTARR